MRRYVKSVSFGMNVSLSIRLLNLTRRRRQPLLEIFSKKVFNRFGKSSRSCISRAKMGTEPVLFHCKYAGIHVPGRALFSFLIQSKGGGHEVFSNFCDGVFMDLPGGHGRRGTDRGAGCDPGSRRAGPVYGGYPGPGHDGTACHSETETDQTL